MVFNLQDEKIDAEKNFGKLKSPDFYKLYYKYNSTFIKLLTDKINKRKSIIADYGGGNSILAEQIIKILNKQKYKCSIDVIDIDINKKINQKNIHFVNTDVLKYHKKEYYDYSLSRFLIHYLKDSESEKFIKNVYNNLKPNSYFLLVNWVIDNDEIYEKKREILNIIEKKKNITSRTIYKESVIIDFCKKAGFSLIQTKQVTYSIRIDDFYKNRFNLTEDLVNRIIKETKIKNHNESQVALLLKK